MKCLIRLVFCYTIFSSAAFSGQIDIVVSDQNSGESRVIDGAVFYLVPEHPQQEAPVAGEKTIIQQDRQFSPYVSVIQAGTQVVFPNKDETAHHVYSFSKAKSFELPLYKKERPKPIYFEKPGVVVLGCNIHDWMVAYILVVDTPYYQQMISTITRFKDIEPGEYTLYFWYPDAERKPLAFRTISVSGVDEPLAVSFSVPKTAKILRQSQAPDDESWNDY